MAEASLDAVTSKVLQQVEAGKLSFNDVLKALAPTVEAPPVPSTMPLPKAITDTQRHALDRVSEVYGKVVVNKPRKLSTTEIAELGDERAVLSEIEKMSKARKGDIRTILFHHFDTRVRERGEDELVERDKDGFFLTVEREPIPDTDQDFSREISQGAPVVTTEDLKRLADDDSVPEFTHQDYLAMTRQVRVFDEHRALEAVRKNPQVLRALAKATTPGSKTAALYVRNHKEAP